MLVVGSREFEEEIKDWTKSYIVVDSWKQLQADSIAMMIEKECLLGRIFIPTKKTSPRPKSERFDVFASSPLPTDELGRIVVVPTSERIVLATDEYGHVIYPIKDATGRLLPVNANGLVVDRFGRLIEFDDYGKPIGPDRRPLPTDESGAYIYPALDSGGKLLFTDGKPLPTNQDGVSADMNRQPIAMNLAGRYSDHQGSTYPFNSDDKIIMAKRTSKITDTTDSTKPFLYSVIDPDNILLSRDGSEIYVNNVGQAVVERDDSVKLQEPDEKSVPTDDAGGFIYPKYNQSGELPRNDSNMKLVYPVIRGDSKLLPTGKSSLPLTSDASPVDINFDRRPLYNLDDEVLSPDKYNRMEDSDGEPRATDKTGNFINRPLPIEVDQGGEPVGAKIEPVQIPKGQKAVVVDLFGRPLPTNKYGDSMYVDGSVIPTDASGKPIGRDGSLMPVDYRGRYISDYMPDRNVLLESELLAKASTCEKVEEFVNIIFVVESSNATETSLNKIKLSLVDFIKKNINWGIAKIGMISYGSTVDVNLDIGNYQSYDDLKESIVSLPLIGGAASGDEHAFRTALQLFREKYNNDNGELIIHIFKTPLRFFFS